MKIGDIGLKDEFVLIACDDLTDEISYPLVEFRRESVTITLTQRGKTYVLVLHKNQEIKVVDSEFSLPYQDPVTGCKTLVFHLYKKVN